MWIFITGCIGFIGSLLAETLLKQGHSIVGIDNFNLYYPKEFKQKNLKELESYSNFKFFYGDIRDRTLLNLIFNDYKFDAIIHLAAKAGVRTSFEIPQEYVDVNINGTINILEAMKLHNIQKFIFASSSSVYGNLNKTYADIKKACRLLNYKPQTTFKDGLRRFFEYTFAREEQYNK